jgi:hypothetical protein
MILRQGALWVGNIVATQLTGLLSNAVAGHIWTIDMQFLMLF